MYRYRHNDISQLQRLIAENHNAYEQIIIVTESIFSMDGDEADLPAPCPTQKELFQYSSLWTKPMLLVYEGKKD